MLTLSSNPTNTILKTASVTTLKQFNTLKKATKGRDSPIPDSFDGRVVWKDFLSPIKNQGKCGSCWAFSSVSCLQDRFSIQSIGKLKPHLSVAKVLLCDFMGDEFSVIHPDDNPDQLNKIDAANINKGVCKGNTLFDAWRYLYVIGTCQEECIPYDKSMGKEFKFDSISDFQKDRKLPLCTDIMGEIGDMCYNNKINNYTGEEYGTPMRLFRCYHYYTIPGTPQQGGNESYIRHNIYCWGPITTAMNVYADFYNFNAKTEIYEYDNKSPSVGGHAIEIVGWGNEKDIPYWIVKNTWGVEYGRDGYFYIKRGTDCCGIESNVVVGSPDFFYPKNYKFENPDKFVWSETPDVEKERDSIDNDLTITGGGIDPELGYTRRILRTKPWIKRDRIINLYDLPDRKTFIAGKIKYSDTYTDDQNKVNSVLIVCICIILICILIYIFRA